MKKDFTNLGQNLLLYICMSEAINFYDRLTDRIATLALGFNPKGMKPSDIQYNL